MESSNAAWISVPIGSVLAARSSNPEAATDGALLGGVVADALSLDERAESAEMVSARAAAIVSRIGVTVSAAVAVAVSGSLARSVSTGVEDPVSETGATAVSTAGVGA
jgi:hypothetical protein